MRCPDCNKFVAYDTEQEPEVGDEDVTGSDGLYTVTAEVRRVLSCAECGTELKDLSFSLSAEVAVDEPCTREDEDEDDKPSPAAPEGEAAPPEPSVKIETEHSHEFEVDSVDVEPTEEGSGKKRKFGYSGEVTIRCIECDHEETVHVEDAAFSSEFEECC